MAIARAVVYEPSLLLLDEPLASLDRRLRQNLQLELRRLQRKLGVAAVYVTHDQEEAMTLADRIVVLRQGRLNAVGIASELYQRPPTSFAASFLGDANFIECEVVGTHGDLVDVCVFPPRNGSVAKCRHGALRCSHAHVRPRSAT